MKRPYLLFLPFLLFVAGAFVACEEVQEEGKYDNWQQRNEAFIDSIRSKTGDNIVTSLADAENMEVGKLFAVKVETGGTSTGANTTHQYVYCKKLWKTDSGAHPLYTEKVSVFYCGTLITGDEFDGNFDGFGATDREELDRLLPLSAPSEAKPDSKWPTVFNSPAEFAVSGVIPGWIWALQYMRAGERWMLYIPWQSAYGSSGNGNITGYSALTFDVCLDEVIAD